MIHGPRFSFHFLPCPKSQSPWTRGYGQNKSKLREEWRLLLEGKTSAGEDGSDEFTSTDYPSVQRRERYFKDEGSIWKIPRQKGTGLCNLHVKPINLETVIVEVNFICLS